MTYLIIGSNSFLGNSLFDYLRKKNQNVFGISSNKKLKKFIFSTYSSHDIEEIIFKIKPSIIFDFKTYKVSNNANHYDKSLDEMISVTENIIKAYEKIKYDKVSINLISTKLLDYNPSTNHPYLNIKYNQENKYKSIKSKNLNIEIKRIPNVLGIGDLNFTRLVPFCYLNYILDRRVVLNSNQEARREYTFLDNFLHNIDNSIKDNKNFILSNSEIINYMNASMDVLNKKYLEVEWEKATHLDSFISCDSNNDEILQKDILNNFVNITRWYLNNKNKVKDYYLKNKIEQS